VAELLTCHSSPLGEDWTDVRCRAQGCPWHQTFHTASAGPRVWATIREHLREHSSPKIPAWLLPAASRG